MKKLVLAAGILLAGIGAKAQTTAIEYSSTASQPLAIMPIGNNDPFPSCNEGITTMPYPMTSTPQTVPAPAALPTSMTYFSKANIDVDMGGGVHYGMLVDICTLTTGTYRASFGSGMYTCNMDVTWVSPSLVTLVFY